MRTADYDYALPPERIAQAPVEPRDHARLLVVERGTGRLSHHRFRDLPELLRAGDLLVANDSRVMPARLRGRKVPGGGRIELLLLRPSDETTWLGLIRGAVKVGTRIRIEGGSGASPTGEVVGVEADGTRRVRFDTPIEPDLPRLGEVPLPPYIRQPLADGERYQTVYARVSGSAAAPTAGLHFTPDLIARLATAGIPLAFVTLHVGLDTFRPVQVERIEDHPLHREWGDLPPATADLVKATRAAGHRVVAVGTTAVRVLETGADHGGSEPSVVPFAGWTDLFITPGHRFRAVDALITNFHLPRSTLLLLVAAFAGKELLDRAYATAMAGEYRFYSFGDAMLVL